MQTIKQESRFLLGSAHSALRSKALTYFDSFRIQPYQFYSQVSIKHCVYDYFDISECFYVLYRILCLLFKNLPSPSKSGNNEYSFIPDKNKNCFAFPIDFIGISYFLTQALYISSIGMKDTSCNEKTLFCANILCCDLGVRITIGPVISCFNKNFLSCNISS